jgi:hypothetical protein
LHFSENFIPPAHNPFGAVRFPRTTHSTSSAIKMKKRTILASSIPVVKHISIPLLSWNIRLLVQFFDETGGILYSSGAGGKSPSIANLTLDMEQVILLDRDFQQTQLSKRG